MQQTASWHLLFPLHMHAPAADCSSGYLCRPVADPRSVPFPLPLPWNRRSLPGGIGSEEVDQFPAPAQTARRTLLSPPPTTASNSSFQYPVVTAHRRFPRLTFLHAGVSFTNPIPSFLRFPIRDIVDFPAPVKAPRPTIFHRSVDPQRDWTRADMPLSSELTFA